MLKIVKNLRAGGAPPRTPLGSSRRSARPLAGGEGVTAPRKNPMPAPRYRPSALRSCPQLKILCTSLHVCAIRATPMSSVSLAYLVIHCPRRPSSPLSLFLSPSLSVSLSRSPVLYRRGSNATPSTDDAEIEAPVPSRAAR